MCPFYPGISQDNPGYQPSFALQLSPRFIHMSFISQDFLGCQPFFPLQLSPRFMYVSWSIPGRPRMLAIIHSTADSQAYLSFHPGISQDIWGCQPSSTLQLSLRLICPLHPGISQGIPGCQLSSMLQLLFVLSILEYPRMLAIFHTTAESQAYVSFPSWDIPGHPRMSAIIHAKRIHKPGTQL